MYTWACVHVYVCVGMHKVHRASHDRGSEVEKMWRNRFLRSWLIRSPLLAKL